MGRDAKKNFPKDDGWRFAEEGSSLTLPCLQVYILDNTSMPTNPLEGVPEESLFFYLSSNLSPWPRHS